MAAGAGVSLAAGNGEARISAATQYAGYSLRRGELSAELGALARLRPRVDDAREGRVQRRRDEARARALARRNEMWQSPIMAVQTSSTRPEQSRFDGGREQPVLTSSSTSSELSDRLKVSDIGVVRANRLPNRNFLIAAGTQIRCVLQTAMDSTLPGFTSCIIPSPVYSDNGRVILLDKGTRVLGEFQGGMQQGQSRIFVVWNRAVTPSGVSIALSSPAADALGRAGWARLVELAERLEWTYEIVEPGLVGAPAGHTRAQRDRLDAGRTDDRHVVGHASPDGDLDANELLALRRAECVRHLLVGDRDAWVDLAAHHGSPADVQRLLRYLARAHDWPTREHARKVLLLAGCVLPPSQPQRSPSQADVQARQRVSFADAPGGVRATVDESILFKFGETTFANEAGPIFDVIKPAFDKARGQVIIEGHTDSKGSDATNMKLSQERADRVRAEMIARNFPPGRLVAKGYGKTQPVADNSTDAGRARKVVPLLRVGVGGVPTRHPLDGGFEVVETAFLYQRRQFRPETARARRFVHNHASPCFLHGRFDRFDIEGQ